MQKRNSVQVQNITVTRKHSIVNVNDDISQTQHTGKMRTGPQFRPNVLMSVSRCSKEYKLGDELMTANTAAS